MRCRIPRSVFPSICALGIVAFVTAGEAGAAERPEASILAAMGEAGVAGLQLAVIRDGETKELRAFGLRDPERGLPVDDATVFSAASLSKPVFAYVVMRLVERGRLDLDRPLAAVLPNDRLAHDARYLEITPRMVLSHASGLPNWGGAPLEIGFEPGSGFRYSGEGFVYLQQAVEKITGDSLDELARREVFEPLGMERSSYVWEESFASNAVVGSSWTDQPRPLERYAQANAAYSLLTTAADYARFVVAVLEGRGLTEEKLAETFRRQVDAVREHKPGDRPGRIYWGLGWGLLPGSSADAIWHWGDNDAFTCFVLARRDRRSAVVYLTNSNRGLSIGDVVLRSYGEEARVALDWAGYDAHDSPRTIARRTLQQAFSVGGAKAGKRAYRRLTSASGPHLDDRLVGDVGLYLLRNRKFDEAVAVHRLNTEANAASFMAWHGLGDACMEAARHAEALAAFERSLELNPDHESARRRIDWVREAVEASSDPPALDRGALERLVGDYGPRHITLVDGVLTYRRDGREPHRLVPLAANLFALDGMATFRLRFELDENGRAVGIVGLYADGRRDESPRTSSASAPAGDDAGGG